MPKINQKYVRKWECGTIKILGRELREVYGENITDNAVSKRLLNESHPETYERAIMIHDSLVSKKRAKKEAIEKMKRKLQSI